MIEGRPLRDFGVSLGAIALVAAGPAMAQSQAPRGPAATPTPRPAASSDDEDAGPDIVVNGRSQPPGSAVGDIPPEQVLGPADIRSYGVSSLSDLLNELSPETRSDRGSGGAPVVLLNGRRISSFAEIRDIPTEAIARVDILPEEVALKYGYTADQRVANVVLRRRFRALTLEGSDSQATAGGRNTPKGELDGLKIKGDNRLNLDLQYQRSSALFENERNVISRSNGGAFDLTGNITGTTPGAQIDPALSAAVGAPVLIAAVPVAAAGGAPAVGAFVPGANKANVTDLSPYRTLLPLSETFSANMVYSRPIGQVNATINGRVQIDQTEAALGLAGVALTLPAGNPFSPFGQAVTLDRYVPGATLMQNGSTIASHVGAGLNGNISAKWRWNLTANYDRTDTKSFIDNGFDASALQARLTANDPGFNPFAALVPTQFGAIPASLAYSTANATNVDGLVNGEVAKLPGGPINTAIHVGGQLTSFDSHSVRPTYTPAGAFAGTLAQSGTVTRNIVNGQINLDVPITSRRTKFLDAIGDLSINGNVAINHLSDFGTLKTIGYGANWSPTPSLRIIVSATNQDQAPSPQQLGNPTISTPNVRVFDYVTGQTVDITQVSGGNRGLIASDRHVLKVGATFKPSTKTDLTIIANYIKTGTDNPIEGFPAATAQVEAAFPGRFTRDTNGALTQIDARPVNFLREDTSELRYGFNLSLPLKSRIQKQFEAFRAGKGPNPLEGLRAAFGNRRPGAGQGGRRDGGDDGGPPPGGTQSGSPSSGDTPPSGAQAGGPGGGFGGGGGRGGFGGGRGGGRGGFGGGGQGGGRLQFAVYHTWHFVDRVTVANGMAPIDLLNGGATGSAGGQPRHEVELQAGYANNGYGLRLSGNYQSATDVTGGTPASPNNLHFGSLAKLNARLFADLTQNIDFIKKHPWARGVRVSLGVSNLFDTRQRVTDKTGAVPLSYQGAYLDPLGRTVSINIRKLFF